jgi:exopolyphosphatase/guanosine-5'-triphosphate,3'-diphosphate pyrophosphatase
MTIHQRIAAGIDMGSNTFRLLVAECTAGNLSVLAKKMATVRLGRGLDADNMLQEKAMRQGLSVLQTFRQTLTDYQPQTIRICGTEALRRAGNSRIFLRKAAEILLHPIDILSPEEEARLSLAGALAGHRPPPVHPLLLVDVGGGSTELIYKKYPAEDTWIQSVRLGVVGLTEKYFNGPQPDIHRLDDHLTETLYGAFENIPLPPAKQPVVVTGCGGTATSMAALDLKLNTYNASMVQGYILQNTSLDKLWKKMLIMPADRRNAMPCLGEGRGEILPAGIRIYQVLLKLLQQDRLRVSDSGLLEGILLSGFNPAAP